MAIGFELPFQLLDPRQGLVEPLLVLDLHGLQLLLKVGLFLLSSWFLRLHDLILLHLLTSSLKP